MCTCLSVRICYTQGCTLSHIYAVKHTWFGDRYIDAHARKVECMYRYIYIYIFTHACMTVFCLNRRVHSNTHSNMCVYIQICIYIYICVCIHIPTNWSRMNYPPTKHSPNIECTLHCSLASLVFASMFLKICIYRHDTGENVNQCLNCLSLITLCAWQLAVCYCATSTYS